MDQGQVVNGTQKSSSDWYWAIMLPVGYIFLVVLLIGMVFYLVTQYSKEGFQPFDLATVVALVGGFSFTAAFADKCPAALRGKLRQVGGLYLLSTIAFIVFGFFQPIDQSSVKGLESLLKVVIPLFFYLGAVPFILALFLTLLAVPQIFSKREA